MCGNNSANLSPDLVPDFSKGFTFPGSTALAEEEGSISHLNLSLVNMAYLKGPEKSISPQTSFYRWGN